MPVIAVGAVGVIVLALLALLIVFAAELLTKLIVNLVSRLPLVGSALGGAIGDLARTVIADTKAACYAVMHPVSNLFYAIATHLVGMWDAAANLADELASTMARLYGHTLPWVINHAFDLSVAWARHYASSLFHDAEAFTRTAVHELDRTIGGIETRARELANTVGRDIVGVDHKIAAVESTLVGDIAAAEVKAVDVARSLANTVRVDLTNALEVAEVAGADALAATAHGLESLIQTVGNDVADLASQGDAAVIAGIDAAASTVAVAAWPVVTDIVDGIKAATVPVEDIIKGAVDAIPAAIPTTLEGVLATTMSLAQVGADYANECGLDLCANLGGLGNFLAGLGNDLETGALFALIALMVTDPQAGAEAVRVTLGPPAAAVAATAGAVFG